MSSTRRASSSGTSADSAISSGVGSRPSSCKSFFAVALSFVSRSIICTGIRIVRAWSAIARVIAWRIHHVAYVENLKPRRYSYLSTARISPVLPSWIRSRKESPLFRYFFAIETTRRRFAAERLRFAASYSAFNLSRDDTLLRRDFGLSCVEIIRSRSSFRMSARSSHERVPIFICRRSYCNLSIRADMPFKSFIMG